MRGEGQTFGLGTSDEQVSRCAGSLVCTSLALQARRGWQLIAEGSVAPALVAVNRSCHACGSLRLGWSRLLQKLERLSCDKFRLHNGQVVTSIGNNRRFDWENTNTFQVAATSVQMMLPNGDCNGSCPASGVDLRRVWIGAHARAVPA